MKKFTKKELRDEIREIRDHCDCVLDILADGSSDAISKIYSRDLIVAVAQDIFEIELSDTKDIGHKDYEKESEILEKIKGCIED